MLRFRQFKFRYALDIHTYLPLQEYTGWAGGNQVCGLLMLIILTLTAWLAHVYLAPAVGGGMYHLCDV